VIAGHGVAALSTFRTQGIGLAVGQNVEINTTRLVIEEPAVVEGRSFASETQVFGLVVVDAGHDVVGQDSLLLLPPGFAVVPHTAVVLFAVFQCALHHVVPAAPLVVATGRWNGVSDLMRKGFIALFGIEAVHAGEVPRHLQVVANHAASLVNAPFQIVGPVLIELFVHEGAVAIVGEVLTDRVERVFQELGVAFFPRSEVQVDQVCRSMVSNGVPVLLGFVDTQ